MLHFKWYFTRCLFTSTSVIPLEMQFIIFLNFLKNYFLIEGWLLYGILLFSVKYQHESAIGVQCSLLFLKCYLHLFVEVTSNI